MSHPESNADIPENAVSSEQNQETTSAETLIQPYPIVHSHEISNFQLLELRTLLDKAAIELERYWSIWLRDRINIVLDRVQSYTWGEVRKRVLDGTDTTVSSGSGSKDDAFPTAIFLRGENPRWYLLRFVSDQPCSQGAIAFSGAMLANLFDRLTGGQEEPTEIGSVGNPLTNLEQKLLIRVGESFYKQWENAWHKILPLEIQSVQVSDSLPLETSDSVALCEFSVRWAQTNLSFYLIVPYYCVTDIERRVDRNHLDWLDDTVGTDVNGVPSGIKKTKICLTVALAETTITAEEFVRMKVGDLITTDQKIDAPIEILVQGRPKFKASPGQLQGQKAVEIL